MKKFVYPGDNPSKLLLFYITGELLALLSSLRFFLRFELKELDKKMVYIVAGCSYDEPELNVAMKHIFVGSSIFIIICIVMIIRNYAFYYKDSKSIYLMKRLPNPAELHVRSLVLPLTAILINIAATGLFMYLYYLYYANLFSINRYFSILEALL